MCSFSSVKLADVSKSAHGRELMVLFWVESRIVNDVLFLAVDVFMLWVVAKCLYAWQSDVTFSALRYVLLFANNALTACYLAAIKVL